MFSELLDGDMYYRARRAPAPAFVQYLTAAAGDGGFARCPVPAGARRAPGGRPECRADLRVRPELQDLLVHALNFGSRWTCCCPSRRRRTRHLPARPPAPPRSAHRLSRERPWPRRVRRHRRRGPRAGASLAVGVRGSAHSASRGCSGGRRRHRLGRRPARPAGTCPAEPVGR
ncbi:hypothetical protein HBB16_16500 [Pseudonocardia sp. MCCB 268]|nr:hypothetical protein [Pseudonocardia cytotoxica]